MARDPDRSIGSGSERVGEGSPLGTGWHPLPERLPRAATGPAEPTRSPEGARRAGAPGAPRGSGRPGAIVGEARGVQVRTEQPSGEWTWQVWTFRIDRFDAAGNPLTSIPVEMRARSIEGAVSEGDWVEVSGPWTPGETLRVRDVHNLTTGALVSAKRESSVFGCVLVTAFLAVFALALVFIVYQILNQPHFPSLNPPSIPSLP